MENDEAAQPALGIVETNDLLGWLGLQGEIDLHEFAPALFLGENIYVLPVSLSYFDDIGARNGYN